MNTKGLLLICLSVLLSILPVTQIEAQDSISFKVNNKRQIMEGFGGSIAYYENWLVAHPKRLMIYDNLFKDLGISILRIRNSYMVEGGNNPGVNDLSTIVNEAKKRGPIDIMISSWSPPGAYKSNGKPANDETLATLASDSEGNFNYSGFAKWWYQSLLQYKAKGIDAKYISIQNEPNWGPGYEGCVFMPQEQLVNDTKLDSTYMVASYATAFSTVYDTIDANKANLNITPKMLGPEVLGIEKTYSGKPSDYTKYMDMSKCYAVAHHLYTGGNKLYPNTYIPSLTQLALDFPNKPRMQTEYSDVDWNAMALLIHNSLVYEEVSAYLVWDLFWPGADFLNLENPWNTGAWVNPNGYKLGTKFFVFKQFAYFVKPGWIRIETATKSKAVMATAFVSPDSTKVTMVLINVNAASQNIVPDPMQYQVLSGKVYRTSATENCVLVGDYVPGVLSLPGKSITTIAFEGSKYPLGKKENYINENSLKIVPNPVVDESTLSIAGFGPKVSIRIINIQGQQISGFAVHNTSELVFGKGLKPGMYILQVSDGSKQESIRFEKR